MVEQPITTEPRISRIGRRWSALVDRNARVMRTVEFSLALACVGIAWTSGGDMALVVPALILALVVSIVGIATIQAPKLYKSGAIGTVTVIYFGIGGFLHWHFLPKPEASMATPSSTASWILSTGTQITYSCETDGTIPDQKTLDSNSANFKKYMEAYADTFGYKPIILSVPGGDRAELTAATKYRKREMAGFRKITFDAGRIGKNFVGVFTAEPKSSFFDFLFRLFSKPVVEDEMNIRREIEDLAGVKSGDCKLM